MISETYKNAFFGAVSICLILATIKHSEYITNNIDIAEKYYFGSTFGILVTCLFVNMCLGIFSLFILGNLNDFIEHMSVNLIGAYQKMRVLSILMLLSTFLYSFSNFTCFLHAVILTNLEKKMASLSLLVTFVQIAHITSMNMIHPDLFGLKLRKDIAAFDRGELSRHAFV